MVDLKITVDQLKNYLGTGLECKGYGELISIRNYVGWCGEFMDKTGSVNIPLSSIQPICYRLSDLDKEIEHNGERFIPELQMMDIWSRYHKDSIKSMYQLQVHETELYRVYHDLKKLFEWHFWTFGDEYFEKGLVIDKRKITENNSKNT